jgi:hypothetical protein
MRTVTRRALSAALVALPLAACTGGGSGGDGQQKFSSYVKELVDETADDTEPASIDDLDVRFDEDPSAYDELFQ